MDAVIIVNYKNYNLTARFVNEQLAHSMPDAVVVVVDNSCNDSDMVRVFADNIRGKLVDSDRNCTESAVQRYVIRASENLGFAKANNLAVEFLVKSGLPIQFLVFSNNDIEFPDGFDLERLKVEFTPGVGLVGPKILGLDGRNQSPYPYVSIWRKYFFLYWLTPFLSASYKRRIFQLDYPDNARAGIYYRVMGSFMVVAMNDFIRCGMMDPVTFLYSEEMILSERLQNIGKSVKYCPDVSVIHAHSVTISKFMDESMRNMMMFENEAYYYRKYRKVSCLSVWICRQSLKMYLRLRGLRNWKNLQNERGSVS